MKTRPFALALALAAAAAVPSIAQERPGAAAPILIESEHGPQLVDPGDGARRDLVDGYRGCVHEARRQPNGGACAFVFYNGNTRNVWFGEAGADPKAIGPDHGRDGIVDLAFSHDGSWLAYQVSGHTVGEGAVHLLSRDGETSTRLTADGAHDGVIDWAPDSLVLAIAATTESRVEQHADVIWVERKSAIDLFDVATSKRRRIATLDVAIAELAWSPDGVELAVLSQNGALYRIALADERVVELARGLSNHGRPRWSPDGQRVLVHRAARKADPKARPPREAAPSRLVVLDRDGEQQWTFETGRQTWNYDWSPDGARIAFTTPKRRLEVVDVATRAVRDLGPVGFWSQVAWASPR